MAYLEFPPLIWAALRFGPCGAISAIFALSTLAIVGTIQGVASFSPGSLSESLFFLQSFMGIIAVTTMILAAVMAERRELEQRKQEHILALAELRRCAGSQFNPHVVEALTFLLRQPEQRCELLLRE